MSLINTQVQPFKTEAFHNGKFVTVTEESLKGKWSVVIFMPAAFTFNCPTEVEDLAASHASDPGRREAQRRLAREATSLVHGPEQAAAAEEASAILFGAPLAQASEAALAAVAAEVPSTTVTRAELDAGIDLIDLVAHQGLLVASKGEGRRALAQGGLYVNGEAAGDVRIVGPDDLLAGRFVLLRKGKKAYAVAVLVP